MDDDLYHAEISRFVHASIDRQSLAYAERGQGQGGFIVLVPKVLWESLQRALGTMALVMMDGCPPSRERMTCHLQAGSAELFAVDTYDPEPTVVPLCVKTP